MAEKKSSLWMGWLGKHSRWLALGLCLSMAGLTGTGCYGRFPLTRGIYDFNGNVSNDKLIRTFVMWAFIIIPVYPIAAIGDAIIFNLVEFWTGETASLESQADHDGAHLALAPGKDGKEAVLTISRDGRVIEQERFIQTSQGVFEARDSSGALRGMVIRTADGGLNFTDAHGTVVQSLSADTIQSSLAAHRL